MNREDPAENLRRSRGRINCVVSIPCTSAAHGHHRSPTHKSLDGSTRIGHDSPLWVDSTTAGRIDEVASTPVGHAMEI